MFILVTPMESVCILIREVDTTFVTSTTSTTNTTTSDYYSLQLLRLAFIGVIFLAFDHDVVMTVIIVIIIVIVLAITWSSLSSLMSSLCFFSSSSSSSSSSLDINIPTCLFSRKHWFVNTVPLQRLSFSHSKTISSTLSQGTTAPVATRSGIPPFDSGRVYNYSRRARVLSFELVLLPLLHFPSDLLTKPLRGVTDVTSNVVVTFIIINIVCTPQICTPRYCVIDERILFNPKFFVI